MKFTIDEYGAARLFILAGGGVEDLHVMLREFSLRGFIQGLQKAKEEFRASTDHCGRCKILSQGDLCNCALCRIDTLLSGL